MHEAIGSLVTLQGITKQFGGVRALAGVDLTIDPGEVLGVVGHNGAGKTTLMQVLIGTIRPSSGNISINGANVTSGYDVRCAHMLGIRCVFQEPSLCPNLRVFENIRILHRALVGLGWPARAREIIREALDRIFPGHGIDTDAITGDLPAGSRQMVEIARAFSVTADPVKLVILDEPTSSLGAKAAEQLMQFMQREAERGASCIFISHRLREVIANTGRVLVMRDGTVVMQQRTAGISEEQLVDSMGVMSQAHEKPRAEIVSVAQPTTRDGPVRVDLRPSLQSQIRLIARAGEVVGLAGLDGHGQRRALLKAFAAARVDDVDAKIHGTVAYVSGDRLRDGVFPLWSVGRNLTIGLLRTLAHMGFLNRREETAVANTWRDSINIKTPDIEQPILSLSGGNQQKVLIARALASEAEVVFLDDPMRGVDVSTKREMFAKIRNEAQQGKCFLLRTTETQELTQCDRVYVFYRGVITEEIDRASFTEDRVLRASFAEITADSGYATDSVTQAASAHKGGRISGLLRRYMDVRVVLPAFALAVMLVVIFSLQSRAMSYNGLRLLLGFALPMTFAAMAQLCVIAASDIDFGLGPFISLVNCIAATTLQTRPLLSVLTLAGCVLAYAGMGAFIQVRRLPSIVVTLGASFVWLGLAILLLPTPGGTAPSWLVSLVRVRPPFIPLPIVGAVAMAAFSHWLFKRTSYGVVLRGIGGAPAAVRRAGWSLLMARGVLYGFAGLFGVVAGLLLTGLIMGGDANIGTPYTLLSVAAVIIGGGEFFGGIVSPIGAVIGAFIMLLTGVLLSFMHVTAAWQLSVQGVILILVLGTRALQKRRST
jgi:ribose transport system ATP-binding protein